MYTFLLCFCALLYASAADDCASKNNTFDGGAFDSNLPVILITTSAPIPSASEDKIYGTLRVFDGRPGRSSVSQVANGYDGQVKVGRRGQSSDVIYCKKQYGIKTRWENDTSRDVELLGLPAESDWVVQGPYADKTQQRQALMMSLSNAVGLYAPRFVFVELMLIEDGSSSVNYAKHYMGVYLVMEQIGRGKDRVDVKKLTNKTADISGGYIVKKDKSKEGNVNFLTSGNLALSMVYPDEEDVTPAQVGWIGGYISCFENALYSPSFTDSATGYPAFINISNFIDYFLLSELSNNADSYKYSTYMHKERGSVLKMGPLWDYDLAFGNVADWIDASASCRPASMNPPQPCTQFFKYEVNARAKIADTSAWYARLLKDPVFKKLVQDRWADLRRTHLSDTAIAAVITAHTDLIMEAVGRNFRKWRDPGLSGEIWPEPNTLDKPCCYPTFTEHVEFLRKYAQGRAAWMDGALMRTMFTIDVAPPALACCSDPEFKSCPKPGGSTCSVSSGDVNAGLGKFYDPACLPGIPGTEGCEGLTSVGACRWCLSPKWDPQKGAGSGSWIKCNLCAQSTPCIPLSPTASVPTEPPSLPPSQRPSEAPTSQRPTNAGDTMSPSHTATLSPTNSPIQPTLQPTPHLTPAPTPKDVGSAQENESETPAGVYVLAAGGVLLVIAAVGAVVLYFLRRRHKIGSSLLHQGLLQ